MKSIKIVSLHFGSGAGHLFGGLALWQAFRRSLGSDFHFYLLTDAEIPVPLEEESLDIYRFHLEPALYFRRDKESMLYQYLMQLDPDVIIVDHIWLPLMPILKNFRAKKVIFFRQVEPVWLRTHPLPNGDVLEFNPDDYDLVFNMEPGFVLEGSISVPPVIGVCESEIKAPQIIRRVLNVPDDKKLALIAHNGMPGELEKILKESDIDSDEYFQVRMSNNLELADQLFPLSHYLSGVDLAIGACGYNFFYETRFYDLKTIYLPQKRSMENQHWRLETNRNYSGPFNGAENITNLIINSL